MAVFVCDISTWTPFCFEFELQATDRSTPSTSDLNRDYTERVQVEMEGPDDTSAKESISLVFTVDNWYEWQTVNIYAIDDEIEEGVDLLYFASQPSYLAYIQGPITVVGEGSAAVPALGEPLMLPHETDVEAFDPDFEVPDSGSKDVDEEKQVDKLIVYNVDVRGSEATVATLTSTQLYGKLFFNMNNLHSARLIYLHLPFRSLLISL